MSAPCCTISNQMKYYTGVFLSELILNELYLDTYHNTEGLFQCILMKIFVC